MKTAIVCISDVYLERGRQLAQFYQSLGDRVQILTPDFSHRSKQTIQFDDPFIKTLPHRPYRKNLSYARLKGHYDFSRSVRECFEQNIPDRIHCLIPANSLAMQMDRFKKEHPGVQLIFDINDLWPESLPAKGLQNLPVFAPWKNLRDHHLQRADLILCECELFARHLEQSAPEAKTLYWCGKEASNAQLYVPETDVLRLAYLGSMNNIIDIALISQLLEELSASRKTEIHLIGQGENREAFADACREYAAVHDHGPIFNEVKKQEILGACHFALNIMKPEVRVGLSLKSLDYLRAGLPLINSLPGDTHDLVEQRKIGINIARECPAQAAQAMLSCSTDDIMAMKRNAAGLYQSLFTPEAFEERLGLILKDAHLLSEDERRHLETWRNG